MATRTDCYPWWHSTFAPLNVKGSIGKTIVGSGCYVNASGNIPCSPESMRSKAEAFMRAHGFGINLSLDEYSFARYMMSEVGNGTIEERVAVGEAGLRRSKRSGKSITQLLAPYGAYGPIHGVGTGTSTAPYNRWAASSQDPDVLTVLLAKLVVSGESGNFANDADDQDGPEAWISKGQASLTAYVARLASEGKYWVGPLPGVDHWRTFLQFTPGISASTPVGHALALRGVEALTLPAQRPHWGDLPVCSKPSSNWMIGLGLAGTLLGAWLINKRGWLRKVGQ